jgi:predicted O-methyltransferase YrrM
MEETKNYINKFLLPIILKSDEKLEGNIFMTHRTTNYTKRFESKIKNIENQIKKENIKNVLEIGFNSGFSSLLMLFSNPNIKITCVDIVNHSYTIPCYKQIKKTFKDRINLIVGDSTLTLKEINQPFDLIHIDGGHTVKVATNDIEESLRLSKNNTILIFDDYDNKKLKELWDNYTENYKLKKVEMIDCKYHDIKQLIINDD